MESKDELLNASISIPDHVVTRRFEGELVALNLESGEYHGLNAVAAWMFEEMRSAKAPVDAVEALVAEYDQPREQIEEDLAQFVRELSERGLVVVGSPSD